MSVIECVVKHSGSAKANHLKRFLVLKCDCCQVIFERDRRIKQLCCRGNHFCSTKCSLDSVYAKDGLAHQKLAISKGADVRWQFFDQEFKRKHIEIMNSLLSRRKPCKQCNQLFGPKYPGSVYFDKQVFCSWACRNDWSATKTTWGSAKASTLETRFGSIYCGSTFETAFVLACEIDERITNLKRSEVKIPYISEGGVRRHYHPDFDITIENKHRIVEVKSTWTVKFSDVEAKRRAANEFSSSYRLLVGEVKKMKIHFDISSLIN